MRKRIRSVAECVNVFTDSVLKHGELMCKDSTAANQHNGKYVKALKELYGFGDDGLFALAKLLDDDRVVVRVTTACYIIHYYTDKALTVLKAAAKEDRGIAMLAIVALKRWELGTYFDPATGKEVTNQEKTRSKHHSSP